MDTTTGEHAIGGLQQQQQQQQWAAENAPTSSSEAALRAMPGVTDWEGLKDVIKDLYMGQNLNLSEVVDRMRAYNLHATPRMYKAQFAKWGWSKYNCKRMRRDLSSGKAVEKCPGKSCYRVKRPRAKKAAKKEEEEDVVETADDDVDDASWSCKESTPNISSRPADAADNGTLPWLATPRGNEPPPQTSSSPPVDPTTMTAAAPAAPAAETTTTTTTTTLIAPAPDIVQALALPYQPAHVNDTARFTHAILSDIRSHVCHVFARRPEWTQSRASAVGLIRAYSYESYDRFASAMDALAGSSSSPPHGEALLRRAFLAVEHATRTDYGAAFHALVVDLPDLLLRHGRQDVLAVLLAHLVTRARPPGAGVVGLAGLRALALDPDPAVLRAYVAAASRLWADLLAGLRGPRDRSALLARRNLLRHTASSANPADVAALCADYAALLRDVHAQYGAGHRASRLMEDVILSTQLVFDLFLDGFVAQNEALLRSVEADYYTTTMLPLPLEEWDVLDRNIRSNCCHRLACFFAHAGDGLRAEYYACRAGEGWRGGWGSWQLEAERTLVEAGRSFEAESLRRCRLEAQYFRKLPEDSKIIFSGGGGMPSSMGYDEGPVALV